jgi:hypothetical protein
VDRLWVSPLDRTARPVRLAQSPDPAATLTATRVDNP